MKNLNPILFLAAVLFCFGGSTQAALLLGSDFGDSVAFNGGGSLSETTDDLDPSDLISVSGWSNINGSGFVGGAGNPTFDGNAQVGMPNSPVIKIDGPGGSGIPPVVGSSTAGLSGVSFDMIVPINRGVNLTEITWDFRRATNSGNQRWLAFTTSEDTGVVWSQVGQARNSFDSISIDLSGPQYQNITDGSITFSWFAGGQGTGDIDFDTVVVSGEVIPEPSTVVLVAISLGAIVCYRRRRQGDRATA